jgi:TonB family protein
MPHALLLSPDDQAVTAITGVLEEMSVTCERPLDGVSAAQKLTSQTFDLVLVDCENLPAAKLIFDVCRRGKNGNNPVPIAIVDGRAGLPTAFRLGAELILTKPVAKDQARATIRTAVGRLRKTAPTSEIAPAPDVAVATAPAPVVVPAEEHAMAAAASADSSHAGFSHEGSSQLTSHDDPASSSVRESIAATSSAAAPALDTTLSSAVMDSTVTDSATMASAVEEIDAAPPAIPGTRSPASFSAHPLTPSDDPVLAELERTEQEESEKAHASLESVTTEAADSQKQASDPASEATKAASESRPAKLATSSSRRQGSLKTRGSLVALLMLAIAAGGFYFAWMYQPGFQTIVRPQIDRILALVGTALPQQPTAARPSAQPAPAQPTPPAPAATAAPDSALTTPDSAANSAANSSAPVAATSAPTTQPSSASGTTVAPAVAGSATTPASATPVSAKPEVVKPEIVKPEIAKAGPDKTAAPLTGATKNTAASPDASLSNAPLPAEATAVILSSKGAEGRLITRVAPKPPAGAQSSGAEGTVVLKTIVDENGKVAGVRLVEGNASLATAAVQAVKQWRYRPFTRDGKAQPFQTVVIVDFQRP